MFLSQRKQTEEVRRVLARAGFVYNGGKYTYTRDQATIKNYLATEDLGAPRQTRRRRTSEVGFFCSLLMMFAVTHMMGNLSIILQS